MLHSVHKGKPVNKNIFIALGLIGVTLLAYVCLPEIIRPLIILFVLPGILVFGLGALLSDSLTIGLRVVSIYSVLLLSLTVLYSVVKSEDVLKLASLLQPDNSSIMANSSSIPNAIATYSANDPAKAFLEKYEIESAHPSTFIWTVVSRRAAYLSTLYKEKLLPKGQAFVNFHLIPKRLSLHTYVVNKVKNCGFTNNKTNAECKAITPLSTLDTLVTKDIQHIQNSDFVADPYTSIRILRSISQPPKITVAQVVDIEKIAMRDNIPHAKILSDMASCLGNGQTATQVLKKIETGK
jgi:hypothetical protein